MGVPAVNRAYSLLTVKAVEDGDLRIIEGIATDISADRIGDVVEPKGASFKLPLPLLWQHRKDEPIGHVTEAKVTASGIQIRAHIAKGVLPRIDEAWALIKAGLVRGLSIGFLPLESQQIPGSFGAHIKSWEWLELSAVTIPMHATASITAVKQFDTTPAASGGTDPITATAVAAPRVVKAMAHPVTAMTKTIQEQKAAFQATRDTKSARMAEIMNKAAESGVTLDTQESEEYDGLETDIKSIDQHLKRLDALEQANIQKAVPVAAKTITEASESRGGSNVIQVGQTLPPGIGFARAVKARLVAKMDARNPIEVAKEMYPDDSRLLKHMQHEAALPNILMQLKAAVPAATTTTSVWAGALVDPTNLPGEFIEFLRPATIIGRLNLRAIPTNVRLIEQTQGGTGYWVGQGAPKPLTAFGYAPVTLSPTKVAAIAVATQESLRYSSPSLDMLIRDALRDALVERVDRDLLDPAEAGTANVQPASLTNGVTALSSAGTSADNARTDIANLVQELRSANLRGPITIVLPDSLLVGMAFMVNSLGQAEFPGLDADGGTYKGIRFISSEYVANASGGGNLVVAIAEREVFLSNDGGVRVDASDQVSLQMLDNPTNNSATATPTTMVSMWQTNSVAFRGEWFINWQKRRSTAVAYIDDVNWGSVGSPA